MDWADDVAYSVHDVEDGVVSGPHRHARARRRRRGRGARAGSASPAGWAAGLRADDLVAAAERLSALPVVAAVGKYDAHAGRVGRARRRLTSELVGPVRVGRDRRHPGGGRPGPAGSLPRRPAGARAGPRRGRGAEDPGAAIHHVRPAAPGSAGRAARPHPPRSRSACWRVRRPRSTRSSSPAFNAAADDGARLRVVVDQIASYTEGRLER